MAYGTYTLPRLVHHLAARGQNSQEAALTKEESKLYQILSKAIGDKGFGYYLRTGMGGGNKTFRELITELHKQYNDVGHVRLEQLIGRDGVAALLSVS